MEAHARSRFYWLCRCKFVEIHKSAQTFVVEKNNARVDIRLFEMEFLAPNAIHRLNKTQAALAFSPFF